MYIKPYRTTSCIIYRKNDDFYNFYVGKIAYLQFKSHLNEKLQRSSFIVPCLGNLFKPVFPHRGEDLISYHSLHESIIGKESSTSACNPTQDRFPGLQNKNHNFKKENNPR